MADVIVGVEDAQHRGFLEHDLRACRQLELAHLGRAIQGLIAQADLVAGKLEAVLYVEAVGGVRQLHPIGRHVLGVYFDNRQATNAQAQGHGVGVQAHAVEHDLVAVGDQVLPVRFGGRRAGVGGHVQRMVDAVAVAADKPGPLAIALAVVNIVFVVFDPRRQAGEGQVRLLGVQRPDFAGGLAAQGQQQLALGA